MYVIESDRASSMSVISSVHPENSFIPTSGGISSSVLTTGQSTQPLTRVADIQTSATGGDVAERTSIQSRRVSTVTESLPVEDATEQFSAHEEEELGDDPLHCENPVMHISGTGHWFLEGWIGDHSVEFLVDSGSSVTAISDVLYGNLLQAGAPVGALQVTARTLRSANGTGIEVLGCSRCSVSFLGLRTEFPIIICSLAAGTDAIIGTDVLGSVLPHTLDIKNGLLFTQGGASLQLHRRDSALSGRVFTVGHSSIPPYSEAVLHCSVRTTGGRALPSSGLLEGLTLFAEETGLIVAGISLASTDLLLHIEPLPMEQLILHDVTTVCSWPHAARGELFAVARRDIAVARRNLARLTHYVDLQDEHLAACDGALDDGLPLMSVEMCSRPTGGVRSVLDVAGQSK